MSNLLSSMQLVTAMGVKNAQGELKVNVRFRYLDDKKTNHHRSGHWVRNNANHIQTLSTAQFNRILLANDEKPLSNQKFQQMIRLNRPLANETNRLFLNAMVDANSELINPESITTNKKSKSNKSQNSGPDEELNLKLQRAKLNGFDDETDYNNHVNTLASMAHQTNTSLAMNSTTSVANSIAHSPQHLTAYQQQKQHQYQQALKKYGTHDEKAAAIKLNNTRQTIKVQQQLAELGQRAYTRQHEAQHNRQLTNDNTPERQD